MCFCGRQGLLTARAPTVEDDGIALQCPACGHLDTLQLYGADLAMRIWMQAKERELALDTERRTSRRESNGYEHDEGAA